MSDTIQDWLAEQERRRAVWLARLEMINEERALNGLPPLPLAWTTDTRPLPTPVPRPASEVLRHELEWPTRSAAPMWPVLVPLVLLAFGLGMLAGLLLARVAPL